MMSDVFPDSHFEPQYRLSNRMDAIVCVKDGGPPFVDCLRSLEAQRGLNKIVVVTPPNDLESQLIAENFVKTEIVLEPDNSCLAFARKMGVEACDSEYVVYVDADVILGKDHLLELKRAATFYLQKYKHIAIEGKNLDSISDKEFPLVTVYGRVSPEHKQVIVNRYQDMEK